MTIRSAIPDDLARLLEIYNDYVLNTPVTFDLEAFSLGARKAWFNDFASDGPYRLLVSESDGKVTGYASSRIFRNKAAYVRSVETSIYLDPEAQGKGIGRELYGRLLKEIEGEAEVHRAYGGVTLPNAASIALHKGCGFKQVGVFGDVGFKFGRYWDVAWFERTL
ncbi:MAG TPA: N-acetyltransferase family protein [Myxococcales bacterium]|nr:N-acetyltransferase family protein [Myxococcales bacterium]HIK85837.1 N-acetyltransferase family protein [Myxococcales bacterium]